MSANEPHRGARRRLDFLWWAALAATALSWAIGETRHGAAPAWSVALVFGLALAKGLGIALEFMELRSAPPVWRRFVVGWLLVVIALIVVLRLAAG